MQAFLPKCLTYLSHYGCHISEELHKCNGGKQQTTEWSRSNNFLDWTKKFQLNEDPWLPDQDIQARNYLLACYADSLIQGDTIRRKPIRYATIRNYVKAATALHKSRSLPNRHGSPINYIDIVRKAVKKYEKQPNRRKMIYDKTIHHME